MKTDGMEMMHAILTEMGQEINVILEKIGRGWVVQLLRGEVNG